MQNLGQVFLGKFFADVMFTLPQKTLPLHSLMTAMRSQINSADGKNLNRSPWTALDAWQSLYVLVELLACYAKACSALNSMTVVWKRTAASKSRGDSIMSVKYVGKETKSEVGGGGCNILTGDLIDYDDSLMAGDTMNTNVFLCVHSPDGVTGGPSSSPFVQMRQANQRRVSMSLSCRSSQGSNAYLSLADLVLGFTGSKPLSQLDLNHSLLMCCLSKTVQHKCTHCLVSPTWLLPLSSQRPRVPSHAYGRRHKWLFFFEIAQREWVMFLIV